MGDGGGATYPPPMPAVPPAADQTKTPVRTDPERTRTLAIELARLASDDKCTDIALLDVRGISPVTDFILIASGTSDRQMRSVLDHMGELATKQGWSTFRISTDENATWLLMDFVDMVVHLFEPTTRTHYDLEMLWGDAPRVEWERPGPATRNRAGLSGDDRL